MAFISICLLVFFFSFSFSLLSRQMQVLRHSEHTLKTALLSKNPVLVSQYEKLDAGEQRLMNEAFQPCNNLFEPITVHSQSDWISSHPEAPQDFEQFFSDRYRKAPCPKKHIIYIQSIGMCWECESFRLAFCRAVTVTGAGDLIQASNFSWLPLLLLLCWELNPGP